MDGLRSHSTDTSSLEYVQVIQRSVPVRSPPTSVSDLDFQFQHNSLANKIAHLTIEKQLNEFMNATTMTTHDIQQRTSLIQDLDKVLVKTSCTLYPVGSFYTGLCDGPSDLDIFADIMGDEGIVEVKDLLDEATNQFSEVNLIINARIPLIKFVHDQTGIQVDLSFGGSENNGRTKSGLIDAYLNVKPRIFRPLLSIIRYWSKFHGLAGDKDLKNYDLSLLVLNFLTRKGLIDSVQKMVQTQISSPDFGYDGMKRPTTAQIQLSNLTFEETFEILLLAEEFFYTFARYDYDKFVICCLTSEWIPKEVFKNVDNCPWIIPKIGTYEYNDWLSSQKSGKIRLNYESLLCIQDPFDLKKNVAYEVSSTLVDKFKMACWNTTTGFLRIIMNKYRAPNPSAQLMSLFQ